MCICNKTMLQTITHGDIYLYLCTVSLEVSTIIICTNRMNSKLIWRQQVWYSFAVIIFRVSSKYVFQKIHSTILAASR